MAHVIAMITKIRSIAIRFWNILLPCLYFTSDWNPFGSIVVLNNSQQRQQLVSSWTML